MSLYNQIEEEYREFGNKLAACTSRREIKSVAYSLIDEIATEMGFAEDLMDAFDFVVLKFKNEKRNDKKTPLVAHSLFLTKMLFIFKEEDPRSYLTAVYHDILEDTAAELPDIAYNRVQRREICESVAYLTESKLLSGKGASDTNLTDRVKCFIMQLRTKEVAGHVISVEIVDRLNDMADLAYLENSEEFGDDEKKEKIRIKMTKCKSIVDHITKDRDDYNNTAKEVFDYRMNELERRYGKVETVPI